MNGTTPTPFPINTSTPTGEPVVVGDGPGSTTGFVQQGPADLVAWAQSHPALLGTIAAATLVVVGVGAALGYYRNDGLDPEVLREMSANGTLAIAIILTTHLSTTLLEAGYLLDVGIGVTSGWALQTLLFVAIERRFGSEASADGGAA